MYLRELHIEGYKGFREPFSVSLQKGLNVIVGENASGKTAIIDAIRLLLREDEFGHTPVNESDFHRPFDRSLKSAQPFRLRAGFADLSDKEHVAFLPWSDENGDASLTLLVDNKQNHRGHYKRTLWGGVSQASMFEWELFDSINCVYLPPLRDAEARLSEGRSSRLARLLKNLHRQAIQEAKKRGELLPIEENVRDFNKKLSEDEDGVIAKANGLIRARLRESFGPIFGQDTHIQFSEVNFNRIAESLRLLFFPDINVASSEDFRTLVENSLGYNNLLYLATVLAELSDTGEDYFSVLLIEEPEAHLHPQLQIRLLKYLESTARNGNVQVIVTTHSPVLASSVSLDTVIQLCVMDKKTPKAIALCSCGLNDHSKAFLNRWLDTTKSTLLFAKGIILVEGIAEAMLLPELAKIVLDKYDELPETLEDCGVSVINMNGIYFEHFMQLFADLDENGSESIPVRCGGITDNDPPTDSKPTPSNPVPGTNPALKLKEIVKKSKWSRLYSGPLKTFEYDLAMEGSNLKVLIPVALSLVDTNGPIRRSYEEFNLKDWNIAEEGDRADASMYLLEHIDKGEFAQALAARLASHDEIIVVPWYICKAIIWACGGNPDES